MSSNISISGEIQNMLHMGFSKLDAVREEIDNSHDAGAKVVNIHVSNGFVTSDGTTIPAHIAVADAIGMDAATASNSFRFHDTKAASSKNGLRGYGENAGHAVLSDIKSATYTLSKPVDGPLREVMAPWPEALKSDTWNPPATEVTVARLPIWSEYAIDRKRGTVKYIPITPETYTYFATNMVKVMPELALTYEESMASGFKVNMFLNGVAVQDDTSLQMNINAPGVLSRAVRLRVLRKPGEDDRVYHEVVLKDGGHQFGRLTTTDFRKLAITDYDAAITAGFELYASLTLLSSYDPTHNVDNTAAVRGYTAFRRNGRTLWYIPHEQPSGGDIGERRVVYASRHMLCFGTDADKLVGVQVNKSKGSAAAVHSELLKVVQHLADKWAKQQRVRPARVGAAVDEWLTTARKMLKTRVDDPTFREMFDEMIVEYDNLPDEEDNE